MFEFFKTKSQEKSAPNLQEKIEYAVEHAMPQIRLIELQYEVVNLKERTDEARFSREDKIEEEIIASSITADTLEEFKEILKALAKRFNLGPKWVMNTLEHENAHANVAEQTGHTGRYMVLFIEYGDEDGTKTMYPLYLSKTPKHWGKIEALLKSIAVIDAPRVYGHRLSTGDKTDLEINRERLGRIEETNKVEVDRVRAELGL